MRSLLLCGLAVAIVAGCAAHPSGAQSTPAPSPSARPVTFVTGPNSGARSATPQQKQASKNTSAASPSSKQQPQQTALPHGSGTAVVNNEPRPLASGTDVRYAPQAVSTLNPQATAPPMIVQPANAPPQILAVTVDKPAVDPGETISADVTTSSNVASVEARVAGRSAVFDKVGEGHFELAYQVPHMPFFLRSKTYMIQLIARNTAGVSVSTAVPIRIR